MIETFQTDLMRINCNGGVFGRHEMDRNRHFFFVTAYFALWIRGEVDSRPTKKNLSKVLLLCLVVAIVFVLVEFVFGW